MRALHRIRAENFLSFQSIDVELGELNVLVGPNGAGESNFLRIIQFLGDTARLDLAPAVRQHGGLEALRFRGGRRYALMKLGVEAEVTRFSSALALDVYRLSFGGGKMLLREEEFRFKRTKGRGRRITTKGRKVEILDEASEPREQSLSAESAGLATLQRLGKDEGAEQVRELAELFETFRIFEIDVPAARQPSARPTEGEASTLSPNAENLAVFLEWLAKTHEDVFALLVEDVRAMIPGVDDIRLVPVGGSTEGVTIVLEERRLRGTTPLGAASYGTVRAIALLAMLHDPNPPKLSCVEEIDHGLHPYALDKIVERMRSASTRTQLLVATHSPAPREPARCERAAGL